ncbi:MAG: AAA family ATPase [Blastocatellia bacterium]|nr:MAG: AAA family ATPase [Blastocatellia bacterium]
MIAAEPMFQMPLAPRTVEETGVGGDMVLQLVTKTLHFAGELSGLELAARLGVHFAVIEPALELLKKDRQCEIVGGALLGAPSYRYRITDAGRSRAALFLEHNQYVGHIPVALEQYQAYMDRLAENSPLTVSRSSVRQAFSHLVLSDHVLDQLGPAIASGHSLFIYGPPGNGKTVISQAIRNLLVGDVAIPHALAVEGQIIRVFDPVNHEALRDPDADDDRLERNPTFDRRWVRCRRPLITVGGELMLPHLDLGYTAAAGFYRAPLQALANGGVLVIDDFGRQHASPRDLLNRWIVPLESRVDYLTLQTGQKFQMPFDVLVVFATNLNPSDLVDEAFLRRIQYKVLAESPSVDQFALIFENYCHARHLAYDRALVNELIETELRQRGVRLRGCQPRDLIEHALALASYLGQPRTLTLDLLSASCATYFLNEEQDVATA